MTKVEGRQVRSPGRPLASTAAVTLLRVARRGSKPAARGRACSVPQELPAAPAVRPPCKDQRLFAATHMSNNGCSRKFLCPGIQDALQWLACCSSSAYCSNIPCCVNFVQFMAGVAIHTVQASMCSSVKWSLRAVLCNMPDICRQPCYTIQASAGRSPGEMYCAEPAPMWWPSQPSLAPLALCALQKRRPAI